MGSLPPPIATTPWIETPCVKSLALSRAAGCNVYLKLEYLQPSGSFKTRGLGLMMQRAIERHGPEHPTHFYCSSGGNAGLACATAAITLKRPATIVVPFSTSQFMISKLQILGAEVVQKGAHWKEADTFLREELLAHDEGGVYVPPFDHEDVWEGHSTMIDEIEKQMNDKGGYSAIVCSVGGGGLLCGVMEGLERHGRLRSEQEGGVKVLAMETLGADSLSLSLRNGKLSRLPAITSIANTLGAVQVAEKAFEWGQRPEVRNLVVGDAEAAMASVYFADDERVLVETACGASIVTAYNGTFSSLLSPGRTASEFAALNVVLVVCGGSNISPSIIEEYRQKYSNDAVVVEKFHHE